MKRSSWKVHNLESNESNYTRSTIISPEMIGKTISVFNGKIEKSIKITPDHVKHRLGEFLYTKLTPRFKKKYG